MITNFTEITIELTEAEKVMASVILGQLKLKYNGKNNTVKGADIVSRMKAKGYEITEVRLRKIVNFLRQLAEPIMATSSGYYYSTNRIELESQVKSLEERANAIMQAAYGIKKYLNSTKQEPKNLNGYGQ